GCGELREPGSVSVSGTASSCVCPRDGCETLQREICFGSGGVIEKAAGGVLTAKQAPHRPCTAPAHGLRAGNDVFHDIADQKGDAMSMFVYDVRGDFTLHQSNATVSLHLDQRYRQNEWADSEQLTGRATTSGMWS